MARIDDEVLLATRVLLAEVGFAATTIQAVARRAGVGVPAIYRRWANRTELIEAAVSPDLRLSPVSHSGDLRTDLQRYVDVYTDAFSAPAARAALPALIGVYQQRPERHRSVSLRVGTDVRQQFVELIRAAPPDMVEPTVDADDLLDLLIGSVLYRVFFRPYTGREERPDPTADLLIAAMRPASRPARGRSRRARPSSRPKS